jgi:hypothetical protein
MNYQKIYNIIIHKAKSENRIKLRKNKENYVYYEKHHIIPKCLGGTDEKENLVLLTAKEHYMCHKILSIIYFTNYKIISAFHYMTHNKRYNAILSARSYEYERILYSSIPKPFDIKEKLKKPKSEEHKKHLSENHADVNGKNNPMYGKKHNDGTIKKLSKIAKLRIGEKNAFFNKKHSTESKEKMSIKHKKYKEQYNQKIYCSTINKIYLSLRDIEKDLQLNRKFVSLCCKNLRNDVKGYKFEYYNE